MTVIPENKVTDADLAEWYRLHQELARIKAAEILLRTKIFKGMFVNPKEGTNTLPLTDGWVLKGTYKINRDIDMALLALQMATLRENGINPDELVKYKPELVLKEYRKMTDEERKLFDTVLVVKPGTPSLEIVMPKKAAP